MSVKKAIPLLFFALFSVSLLAQPASVQKSEEKVSEGGVIYYLHKVEQGQTLWSISKAYAVDQNEIIRANPEIVHGLMAGQVIKIMDHSNTAVSPISLPDTTQPKYLTHVVSSGETLYALSRKYGVTAKEIVEANPQVEQFENLAIGQLLNIPVKRWVGTDAVVMIEEKDSVIIHEVQRGESLFGIARQYETSQDSLLAWNPELKDKALKKGQQLRIILRTRKTVYVKNEPVVAPKEEYDTLIHQIQDKETLWGLAKRYNTTADLILALNPELSEGLKKGYYIYIPVPAAVREEPVSTPVRKTGGCELSRYKSKYKVALLIPLYLDEIDRISIPRSTEEQIRKPFFKPFSFVEFYEGVLIALDSMKHAGLSVDLHVYDTGNDTNKVKKLLLNPEMPYMDLVIGPFFPESYGIMADFSAKHHIKMVSPFSRNQNIVSSQKNIFQLNASSESKMAELGKYVAKTWAAPNVIMVMKDNEVDKNLSATFRKSLEAYGVSANRKPQFHEVNFFEKGVSGVSTKLDVNRPNIVINLITGETTISNYVTNMAKLTESFDIVMFGLPEWREYRIFDLSDLMAVKMHLFSNTYIDYSDPVTSHFLQEFRMRYKGDPEEDNYAFLGYDITLYFLKALYEYGLDFENCLDQLTYHPVSTGFRWKQVGEYGFENIYLNIFRYTEFKTERVKQPLK